MCKGFMFISREKIDDFEWSNNPNVFYVFFKLLFKASYKDKKWEGVDIKRGQLVTGRVALSKELNVSEQVIRTCLDKLTKTGYINQQTTNRYTIITICNYDSWQVLPKTNNQQPTNEPTNNQPTDNHYINKYNKENKDIKEEESNDSKKKLVYPQEYENDFLLYGRKGSKKNGFKRWKELTEEEKVRMRLHIPYYLQSNDRQFLKDFEGYINQRMFESPVYQGSILLYDPMQREQPEGYHPLTDNCQIWEEKNQCLRIFNGDIDNLNDGYTDGNRPEGATVAWGMYSWKWSKLRKEWVKQ